MNLNPSVIDFSSVITRTGTFSESLLLYQSINDKMFTPCTVRSLIVVHGHFAYYMFFFKIIIKIIIILIIYFASVHQ